MYRLNENLYTVRKLSSDIGRLKRELSHRLGRRMGLVQSRHASELESSSLGSALRNESLQLGPSGLKGCTLGAPGPGGPPHTRSGSVRGAPRQPMPDAIELERRFTKVLVSFFRLFITCLV